MRYVNFSTLGRDSKYIPEGEVFTIFLKPPEESTLKDNDNLWAFAARIKKEVTISRWNRDTAPHRDVKIAYAQVQFAIKNGWSGTGEKKINEYGEMSKVWHCLYCKNHTGDDVKAEAPCECRGIKPKYGALKDFLFPTW